MTDLVSVPLSRRKAASSFDFCGMLLLRKKISFKNPAIRAVFFRIWPMETQMFQLRAPNRYTEKNKSL
ncbi:MAG: hypothetical protein HYS17_04240 [Micavibrio aeruginosavorus]|uniref:Uncharacterized protein n=1 Tax=Micavibrio aeruginosavorus TaxID=349221 RepID=A0A7T5UI08_9BACT|nr:MAG: hypothetical protein HYS17_04240 [Micavibrio aeruginosavorus]